MFQRIYRLLHIHPDEQPWVEFVLRIGLIYAGWKLLQLAISRSMSLEIAWNNAVSTYAHKVATAGNKLLEAMGFEIIYHYQQAVYIAGTPGFYVEEHCLAVPATLIFGTFIAAFHGPWKHKLWYIPLGMLAVQAINFGRIIFLALIMTLGSEWFFHFNHSFLALILEYGMVFFMIALWMRKYAQTPQAPSAPSPAAR
jgi:exosortase/archaeosortase family protein